MVRSLGIGLAVCGLGLRAVCAPVARFRRPPVTPLVEFHGVGKQFEVLTSGGTSLRDTVLQWARGTSSTRTFWALQDASFQIDRGETVALIGPNGSGKTTALKLLARILEPTVGSIHVNASISTLLELGASFHPDYTGRENLYLFGSYHGLSRSDVRQCLQHILDFAELGTFIDEPVRHYSNGMYLRLAMSAATIFDPDILAIDELLSVGDEGFQAKCTRRFLDLQQRGRTLIVASHNAAFVRRLCTRAIRLEHGQVVDDGPAEKVVDQYVRSLAA